MTLMRAVLQVLSWMLGLLPLYELYAARASPHRSQNPSGAIAHEPSDRAKHKRPGCPDP